MYTTTIGIEDQTLTVEYCIVPAERRTRHHPGNESYIEIHSVTKTDIPDDDIIKELEKDYAQRVADYEADRGDWLYEQWKDKY